MVAEKKREIYWLSILTLIFVIGNFAAWKVMEYTLHVNLNNVYAIPWMFLITPLILTFIALRKRLLKPSYRYKNGAIAVLALSFLTWVFVVSVYLKNMY